jgi:hypothetical protein
MTRPIVVIGHPRSGTSLVCGLLNRAGVWCGFMREPDATNPKGDFENEQLRRLPANGHTLISWTDVERILAEQGYTGGPWLVKIGDPARWWRWRELDPITIKVRRTHASILASALDRKKIKGVAVGTDYAGQLSKRIERTVERMEGIPGFTVWPENLVHGRDHEFRALFHELNLPWDMGFWEPNLWHH